MYHIIGSLEFIYLDYHTFDCLNVDKYIHQKNTLRFWELMCWLHFKKNRTYQPRIDQRVLLYSFDLTNRSSPEKVIDCCSNSSDFSNDSGNRWAWDSITPKRRQYIPGIQAVYTANWVIICYLPYLFTRTSIICWQLVPFPKVCKS